jgi:hypothetical protein
VEIKERAAIIWLLFDVGLCLVVASVPHVGPLTSPQTILLVQFVFALGIAFGLAMDYSRWKRNHKPVIDEIGRMLNDIEAFGCSARPAVSGRGILALLFPKEAPALAGRKATGNSPDRSRRFAAL